MNPEFDGGVDENDTLYVPSCTEGEVNLSLRRAGSYQHCVGCEYIDICLEAARNDLPPITLGPSSAHFYISP